MSTRRSAAGEAVENPAAVADAEQHALQDIAGLRARVAAWSPRGARLIVAAAGGALVSGWVILRRRRRR